MGKKKSKSNANKASGSNSKNAAVQETKDEEVEEEPVVASTQANIADEKQEIVSDVIQAPDNKNVTAAEPESVVEQSVPVTNAVSEVASVVNVCYIEVNDSSLSNVADYVLENGQNVFNFGIIFAANIHKDPTTGSAVLYYNPQVTKCLQSGDIKLLQDKGIKVLLSILGDHQGVGVCNFPTQAAAQDFAQQVVNAVQQYNLDGVDIDDEWAEYDPQPNDFSFVYFVEALRNLLPAEKVITWYYYGEAMTRQSYNNVEVGSFLTYSWNATYGSFNAPVVPPLGPKSLSAAAVQVNATPTSEITDLAKSTVQQGYGVFMWYNLPDVTSPGGDYSTQLSAATAVLYVSDAKFIGSIKEKPVAAVEPTAASAEVKQESEEVPNDTTLPVTPSAESNAASAPTDSAADPLSEVPLVSANDDTTETIKPGSTYPETPATTTVSSSSDDVSKVETSDPDTVKDTTDAVKPVDNGATTKNPEVHCMDVPMSCGCVVC